MGERGIKGSGLIAYTEKSDQYGASRIKIYTEKSRARDRPPITVNWAPMGDCPRAKRVIWAPVERPRLTVNVW